MKEGISIALPIAAFLAVFLAGLVASVFIGGLIGRKLFPGITDKDRPSMARYVLRNALLPIIFSAAWIYIWGLLATIEKRMN